MYLLIVQLYEQVWPACCRNAILMCITYDSLDAYLQNFNRKAQTGKSEMLIC